MKQVVAFLEKYAQWLAMGVAGIFLLFVVYSFWVSPDQLKVKVGSQELLPGEVDTAIANDADKGAARLKRQMDASSDASADFKVPDFQQEFAKAMGGTGLPTAVAQVRPHVPTEGPVKETVVTKTDDKVVLPKIPAPEPVGVSSGQSLIAPPIELAEGEAPPAVDRNAALATAIQKDWATVEAKISAAQFAKVWLDTFGKANALPPEAMVTQFFLVETERQELIGPDKWSSAVQLKPLPLVRMMEFPRGADPQQNAEYKVWSEKHQVDIVEPAFYTVLHGDLWFIPSRPLKVEGPAVPVVDNQPFDPANPPTNRELTSQEKQQVYIYKQKKAQEEQKSKSDAGRSKAAAAEQERRNRPGGGGAAPRGYAPMPPILAAPPVSREGLSEDNSRRGPMRPIPGREGPSRFEGPTPGFEGRGMGEMIQGGAPTGPFDPSRLVEVRPGALPGASNDIIVWAHDDTVVPGKTYRYRMRVYIRNPLYQTVNVAKNAADEKAFAIVSDWSAWSAPANIPPTTLFQFALAKTSLKDKVVTSATVNVFKRDKGDWSMETFTVAPGDSIGWSKNNIDFTTGATLVDLRADLKDTRIIIASESGDLMTRMLHSDQNDPVFKDLTQRIKAAAAAGAGGAEGEGANPGGGGGAVPRF